MKRISFILSLAMMALMLVACGGSGSGSQRQASVTLGTLDDYFTVKKYTLESDAKEKGIEKLDYIKGTVTIEVKRNNIQMKFKPSDVIDATIDGEVSGLGYYVFRGDCEGVVRKMMKMEPNTAETFSIGISAIDPYNKFSSDEENAAKRQSAFDALTKPGCLDQISIDVGFKEDYEKVLKSLNGLVDDDDEDGDW